MNLRLLNTLAREQEIEVAPLVGPPDMGRIHRPITALIVRRGLTPGIDTPRIGIDFDLIPGAHESGPPAAMRLSHLKPGCAQRGRLIVLAQKMLHRRWLVYEQQFASQPPYRVNIDT
jgi:hypothetical protein